MNKLYLALTLAATAAGMTAQQLPDAGFQADWVNCIPWTSSGNTTALGTQPADWHISNVIGMSGIGKTEVGEKVDGYNSTQAVKLSNKSIIMSQKVPGYLTLGTPWNTSVMGKQNDGGTFGGFAFGYRPDALSFMYKRTADNAAENPFTVVAYTWTGETQQADVPGNIVLSGSPKTATLVNRDRNILGIETIKGGAITKSDDFALIAEINKKPIDAPAEWTNMVIPFDYKTAGTAPAMINVIFAAGDYFSATPVAGNTLTVDDVQLIYWSQLSSLKIGGTELAGFDKDTYTYDIQGDMPAADQVAYTVLGQAASAAVATDAANNIMTITVTNADSGESHAYTLNFTPGQDEEGTYNGLLYIHMLDSDLANGQPAKVMMTENPNGTVKFTLPDFTLEGIGSLGDIVVPELTATPDGEKTLYQGSVDDLILAEGEIHAQVEVHGYITDDGEINLAIPVKWLPAYPVTEDAIDIDVRFYTQGADWNNVPMGITGVAADNDAPAIYYNLQGQRVADPQDGVYLRVQGGKAVKVAK